MRRKVDSFSCSGWKSKAAEFLPLAAGLVLTAAAILLARSRIASAEREIQRKSAPVDIVVASVPIEVGAAFCESNLARRAIPSSGTGSRNVPAKEFELLLGARAKSDIAAGEPILWTDVDEPFDVERFSQVIPEGQRAVTVEADVTSSFAGLLRPGDRVDLFRDGDPGGVRRAWLRNVPVLAVDRNFNRPHAADDGGDAGTITLLVSPEDGSRLAALSRQGRIRWLLRNPGDNSAPLAAARPSGPRPDGLAEIWHAGIRVAPRAALPGGTE